jgi:hypothetical protein
MPEHSKLANNVHDLLDEAHRVLLDANLNVRRAVAVITKLRDCADQAREAGNLDSEQHLKNAADHVVARLGEP